MTLQPESPCRTWSTIVPSPPGCRVPDNHQWSFNYMSRPMTSSAPQGLWLILTVRLNLAHQQPTPRSPLKSLLTPEHRWTRSHWTPLTNLASTPTPSSEYSSGLAVWSQAQSWTSWAAFSYQCAPQTQENGEGLSASSTSPAMPPRTTSPTRLLGYLAPNGYFCLHQLQTGCLATPPRQTYKSQRLKYSPTTT